MNEIINICEILVIIYIYIYIILCSYSYVSVKYLFNDSKTCIGGI